MHITPSRSPRKREARAVGTSDHMNDSEEKLVPRMAARHLPELNPGGGHGHGALIHYKYG